MTRDRTYSVTLTVNANQEPDRPLAEDALATSLSTCAPSWVIGIVVVEEVTE